MKKILIISLLVLAVLTGCENINYETNKGTGTINDRYESVVTISGACYVTMVGETPMTMCDPDEKVTRHYVEVSFDGLTETFDNLDLYESKQTTVPVKHVKVIGEETGKLYREYLELEND